MKTLMDCSRLLKNTSGKREWKNEIHKTKLYFTSVFGNILNLKIVHCDPRNKEQTRCLFPFPLNEL